MIYRCFADFYGNSLEDKLKPCNSFVGLVSFKPHLVTFGNSTSAMLKCYKRIKSTLCVLLLSIWVYQRTSYVKLHVWCRTMSCTDSGILPYIWLHMSYVCENFSKNVVYPFKPYNWFVGIVCLALSIFVVIAQLQSHSDCRMIFVGCQGERRVGWMCFGILIIHPGFVPPCHYPLHIIECILHVLQPVHRVLRLCLALSQSNVCTLMERIMACMSLPPKCRSMRTFDELRHRGDGQAVSSSRAMISVSKHCHRKTRK